MKMPNMVKAQKYIQIKQNIGGIFSMEKKMEKEL